MSYRTFQPSTLPAWLQGVNGLAYAGVLGGLKDIISNRARGACKVGMPGAAPSDALAAIGYERQLPRGASESDGHYAERLRMAWDAWALAGTALGMLLQFEVLYPGIPVAIVQQAGRAFTLNPDTSLAVHDRLIVTALGGGGWTFDANGGLPHDQGLWNRAGVIFPGPLPPGWASAVVPPTTATTPTIFQVNDMIRLIQKWKSAKALFQWIKVVTAGVLWGVPPSLTWGSGGLLWGGDSVVTFSASVEY